jgi:transposase
METATQARVRRRGPKLAELTLTNDERTTLQRWARRAKSSQALALRCRIVLACAEGASNASVATRLGISRPTVTKWRSRFVARRLEGLADEPRPGAARTISDEQVERVLVMTLETTPKDATHWSTRSLARQVGMSQSAISRIWRAFALKPHLVDRWSASSCAWGSWPPLWVGCAPAAPHAGPGDQHAGPRREAGPGCPMQH